MTSVLRLITLILALASLASSFSCGSNRFQNSVTSLFVKLDCKGRLGQFDSCCRTHDSCYDRQNGRGRCDDAFCSCLKKAAKGTLCVVDSAAFCTAVRTFGGTAYANAGNKG